MDKEYPCRTKEISGTTYVVKFYLNGELRMSASRYDKEDADSYVERMQKALPNFTFEISSHPWTNNVCIECGREEY